MIAAQTFPAKPLSPFGDYRLCHLKGLPVNNRQFREFKAIPGFFGHTHLLPIHLPFLIGPEHTDIPLIPQDAIDSSNTPALSFVPDIAGDTWRIYACSIKP